MPTVAQLNNYITIHYITQQFFIVVYSKKNFKEPLWHSNNVWVRVPKQVSLQFTYNETSLMVIIIIIIIITDNKSLQQKLISPLTSRQLDKIVKNTKEIMSQHLIKCSK